MKKLNKVVIFMMVLIVLGIPLLFKSFAEFELKNYAFKNYNRNLTSPVDFNWMTMNFESQFDIDEREYSLVYSVFDFQVIDDYLNFLQTDKFDKSLLEWSTHLPRTTAVEGSIFVNVDAFEYSNTSNMLYLSVKNSSRSLQNASIDQMAAIAYDCISFLKKDFRISGIQVIYFDLSGGYTIVIPYSPWREEINLAMLSNKASKLNLNEMGEVELKWIEDNNK
jgi:hypothetical protein